LIRLDKGSALLLTEDGYVLENFTQNENIGKTNNAVL
jgi:hypothetical protein